MKGKIIERNPILTLFLILTLVLSVSIIPALVPATPVMAAVTGVTINTPTTGSPAYVKNAGTVPVNYTLAGSGNCTVEIFIKKDALQIGSFGPLTKDDGDYTNSVTVFTSTEGYYDVYIVCSPFEGGTHTDTNTNAVIVDNTAPTVIISYPTGGECVLGGGTADNVTWYDNDFYSTTLDYAVYLSTNGGATYPTLLTSGSATKGNHSQGVTWPGVTSLYGLCKVRVDVTDDAGNSCNTTSTSLFTIDNDDPVVNLTSPTGGEIWDAGSSHDITWTATDANNTGTLDYLIEYSTDGGGTWTTEANQTGQTLGVKTYDWTVPAAHSSTCWVKVTATDCAGNQHTDTSTNFVINDTTDPVCTVTAPNGGESWASGSTHDVAWTCTDNVPGSNMSYALYYCTSYSSCDTCVTGVIYTLDNQPLGSQTYSWTVPTPAGTAPFTSCRVRVLATDKGSNTDADCSDANFTITVDTTAPTVTLTDPTGPWQAGTCQTISWTASDNIVTDTLEVELTYGATLITTLRGVAQGSGSYSWAIPNGAVGSTTISIFVTDESSNDSTTDTSAAFTVNAAGAGYAEDSIDFSASGWYLISLKLVPPCTDIESVLGDIIPNVLYVWSYSGGTSGSWSGYSPGGPTGLTTMEDGKAYWINMDTAGTLAVKGTKGAAVAPLSTPAGPYSYVTGWNLVGFKSTIDKTVETYLGGTCGTTYAVPISGYFDGSSTSDNCTANMASGYGYWVYFNQAHSVTPGID